MKRDPITAPPAEALADGRHASDSGPEATHAEIRSAAPHAASSETSGRVPEDIFAAGFSMRAPEAGNRAGEAGTDSGAASFFPVRYAHHPKPDYPERARREGWEGTVLLRVLVDQKGTTKGVEVSQSSGFEILDRAAVETVKGWRFQPARSGENALESWVKVPIVFRLVEIKNER